LSYWHPSIDHQDEEHGGFVERLHRAQFGGTAAPVKDRYCFSGPECLVPKLTPMPTALKAEGTRSPTAPYVLASFHDADSINMCKVMSDADVGGFSQASLDWREPSSSASTSSSEAPKGFAQFHGKISTELPANKPHIQRTGYAAWRTLDRPPTIFGKSLWNIDPYTYLALRVKSDGRKYFVNVQTESIVPTDIHQHRLYARRPGEWETVLIKWNEFVRTNHGVVVEPQTEMLRQKVRTIGIGLIDRIPGPFELCIEKIWATNSLTEHDAREDGRLEEGQLKSKHGERIRWSDSEHETTRR
jgi:NADH dehydrogenase [ubiquinone] 1 alpha subcomplex assembly factor 1